METNQQKHKAKMKQIKQMLKEKEFEKAIIKQAIIEQEIIEEKAKEQIEKLEEKIETLKQKITIKEMENIEQEKETRHDKIVIDLLMANLKEFAILSAKTIKIECDKTIKVYEEHY